MTAKAKRAERAPENEADPNSGTKIPVGSHGEHDEPPADPKPSVSSDESSPNEDEGDGEPEPEASSKTPPVPEPVKKTKSEPAPSLLARFGRWWLTDLDGQ